MLLLIVSACCSILPAQSVSLPLSSTKPGTRWWWPGSAVDSAGLEWNLDQLKQAGIGTVEITPIYGVQGNERNELPFLSPRWMKAIRQTQQIAARNGIEVDMNTGTGWPFGGLWVPLEEAACKAIFVDTIVGKNMPIGNIQFNVPSKEKEYSRLGAVQTFPTGDKDTKRVIALYVGRTRQQVKRAAPGGEGLVIDHFDAVAVKNYLAHIDSAFTASGTPYPHTFFNDSYEVYDADWTPGLPAEFEKRRGYSLLDNLDKLVDGDVQVVSDYRETLSDLLYENFTKQWVAWAHSRNVQIRNQAHGSPANLLDLYGEVDIPEIEGFGLSEFGIKGLRRDPGFIRKNFSDVSMLKYASSAAHVMGKRYTSSETFTWLTEHFRTSLSQMKPDLDLMFTCGVNRVFFHGTAYSPKDEAWPGWRFYASIDMSPANSIWRDVPFLNQYIDRCQKYLQWGEPDNDFLVYLPVRDMWKEDTRNLLMQFDIHSMYMKTPKFIKAIMTIDSLGYDCDYISDRQMAKLRHTTADGYITEGGASYKGLIDPRHPIDAQSLARMAKAEELKTKLHLRYIRRKNDDGHHYFIVNLTPNDVDGFVTLAVDWKQALWYNPMNGKTYNADTRDGKLHVSLKSGESLILFAKNVMSVSNEALASLPLTSASSYKVIDTSWTLSFVEEAPRVDKTWRLAKPRTWETLDDDNVKVTMGTGVYSTIIKLNGYEARKHWAIDLGDVRESARVYINGKMIGCAWAVPFVLDCQDALKKGRNEIRIEVTNLPANRIADLDRKEVVWRKMKDINVVDLNYNKTTYAGWEPVKSGLNSEIKLIEIK